MQAEHWGSAEAARGPVTLMGDRYVWGLLKHAQTNLPGRWGKPFSSELQKNWKQNAVTKSKWACSEIVGL